MEPPVGPEAAFLQDEKSKVFAATEACAATRSSGASTSATGTSRGWRPTPRSRPSWRRGCTSTHGAGLACRSTSGPERPSRRPPPRPWSSSTTHRASSSTRPADPSPHRNLVRFRLAASDGVTFTLQAKTPGAAHGQRGHQPQRRLRRRPGRASGRLRAPARTTRWSATRGASPARTWWSGRGASSSRRSTIPGRCTPTSEGPGGHQRPRPWFPTAGTRRADGRPAGPRGHRPGDDHRSDTEHHRAGADADGDGHAGPIDPRRQVGDEDGVVEHVEARSSP